MEAKDTVMTFSQQTIKAAGINHPQDRLDFLLRQQAEISYSAGRAEGRAESGGLGGGTMSAWE